MLKHYSHCIIFSIKLSHTLDLPLNARTRPAAFVQLKEIVELQLKLAEQSGDLKVRGSDIKVMPNASYIDSNMVHVALQMQLNSIK